MPEALIHCQNCRELLNPDLETDSVEIPDFQPLQEISTMVEAELRGYFVQCPECERELRVNRKYKNERLQCNFCNGEFVLDVKNPRVNVVAFYSSCPHCSDELRAAVKYLGTKVACKHCGGKIHFVGNL